MSVTPNETIPTPAEVFAARQSGRPASRLTHRLADITLETVRVAVCHGDNLLVGQRSEGTNPKTSGKHELLGGKIDPEDRASGDIHAAIARAGIREVRQECGASIVAGEPSILHMHQIPDTPEEGRYRGMLFIEYLLEGALSEGERPEDLLPSEEHQWVGWRPFWEIFGNPQFRDGTDTALHRLGYSSGPEPPHVSPAA